MHEYHKIQSIYLRDPANNHKTFLLGQWAQPEFGLLDRLLVRAGFKSKCAVDESLMAEGLVLRPEFELRDRLGRRIITKIKSKDFV